ncbi:MAG TPA: prenyltransferase [Methanospirillum sp.]|nr:prenyltransferase [Methanospirillum sp.]
MNRSGISFFHGFLLLSRLPFHAVGVLPFILGTLLATHDGYQIQPAVLGLGILGTVFIMLATYYSGEFFDQEEDTRSGQAEKSRFSGGSQAIQLGLVHPNHVIWAAFLALGIAGCIGVIIWLGLGTGPLTIPLGALGMAGGFLYSAKPIRWVSRGLGEIWIAFCYGWLPVAAAYYLQSGEIPVSVTLLSIPIALSIFAVILMNEFADYDVDKETGKRNLLVRFGTQNGAYVYAGACLGAASTAGILAIQFPSGYVMVPPILLGTILSALMLKGGWKRASMREWLCGGTLLLNLGITGAYIAALWW